MAFSVLPDAAAFRVNVMIVFPLDCSHVAPVTATPFVGFVCPVLQYRSTPWFAPEQITISAFVMLVPTPKPTHALPVYVTTNDTVVLSEERVTSAFKFALSVSVPLSCCGDGATFDDGEGAVDDEGLLETSYSMTPR